jgi:ribosomal-protein-alanine N-acetyltransferase
MDTVYETKHLLLKHSHISYTEMVVDYCLRNRAFLEEWEPIRKDEFYTSEYQLKQLCDDLENKDLFRLWIFKKENEEKIIGCLSFTNIMRGAFLSCFFGYKLDEQEINHGYMTEAIKKGTEIMFQDLGLHRIEANIMPKNKRSLRAAEKAGFYNEGLSYKYLKINGKWEDHIHMVLLNEPSLSS